MILLKLLIQPGNFLPSLRISMLIRAILTCGHIDLDYRMIESLIPRGAGAVLVPQVCSTKLTSQSAMSLHPAQDGLRWTLRRSNLISRW